MPRHLPLPPYWAGVRGRRVRLTLVAPHFDEVALPTLTGRLAGALPGYFGLYRYLVELDSALGPGFDPLGELPWFARGRRLRHLVVTPAPDAPTLETPPDVIGETVARGGTVHVFVSAGPSSRAMRVDAVAATAEARCPFLSMGDLQALPEVQRSLAPVI